MAGEPEPLSAEEVDCRHALLLEIPVHEREQVEHDALRLIADWRRMRAALEGLLDNLPIYYEDEGGAIIDGQMEPEPLEAARKALGRGGP